MRHCVSLDLKGFRLAEICVVMAWLLTLLHESRLVISYGKVGAFRPMKRADPSEGQPSRLHGVHSRVSFGFIALAEMNLSSCFA